MKNECPNCQSRATETLAAAYAKGTRVLGSRLSHSAWAARCAPPEPLKVLGSYGFGVLITSLMVAPWVLEYKDGVSLNWDLLATPYFGGLTLVGIGCLVAIVFRFFLMLHHLFFRYEDEYTLWERQWICRDCGTKFNPDTLSSS